MLSLTQQQIDDFGQDIHQIKKTLSVPQSDEMIHYLKMYFLITTISIFGLCCAWMNPLWLFPALAYCVGITLRWTMIGHHTIHGGYDKLKIPNLNRRSFAMKMRRYVEWLDWMLPEAWDVEHNHLHHYRLGEDDDPDLVENNMGYLRDLDAPLWVKKIAVFVMASIWKWWYYAPNTYKHLTLMKLRSKNPSEYKKIPEQTIKDPHVLTRYIMLPESWLSIVDLSYSMMPYFIYTFCIIPGAYYALNPQYGKNALLNMLMAEILSNVYSFIIIATNHCGDDLYRFDTKTKIYSGEFYLRQVISSANYTAGNDWIDCAHGWLNYQIEHHLFPDKSMLWYRKAMPLVKAVCKKHNIPYVQESVWTRLGKTVDIMIGKTSMRKFEIQK